MIFKSIISILLLSFAVLRAQSDLNGLLNYADSIYSAGNYFDAITEYKRVQFFDNSNKFVFITNYKIGKCYKAGLKLGNAQKYFSLALSFAEDNEIKFDAELELLKTKLLSRNFLSAKEQISRMKKRYPDTEKSNEVTYWEGWNLMLAQKWKKAEEVFRKIEQPELANLCKNVADDEYDVQTAKLLSYFLPGAGQFYTGEYLSGLMSLAWNALWGYTTVKAFMSDRIFDGIIVGNLLWFRFYRGNFQNAEKFAIEKNREIYNNVYLYLNDKYKGKKP